MKKIRLRKSRCIGENPVFPEVFYQYLILYPDSLNFRDVLANKVADYSAVDTEYFQKNSDFKWLNFSSRICFVSAVSILLGFVIH